MARPKTLKGSVVKSINLDHQSHRILESRTSPTVSASAVVRDALIGMDESASVQIIEELRARDEAQQATIEKLLDQINDLKQAHAETTTKLTEAEASARLARQQLDDRRAVHSPHGPPKRVVCAYCAEPLLADRSAHADPEQERICMAQLEARLEADT